MYPQNATIQNMMYCTIEDNTILQCNYGQPLKKIGVTMEKYNDALNLLSEYRNKLIELGVIEKEKTPEDGEKKRSLNLTFRDIRSALPALWESLKRGLRKTRQRLRIDPMHLSVCFGGDDPAQVAELYGWANTAMWTVMPEMERLTRMPDPHIHLETDFTASETHISGEVGLSFRIGDLLAIGFAFAGPALRWYRAFRKEKSEQEKKAAREKKPPENTKNQAPAGADATT